MPKLIYVFDAYCGWCYGFGPTVMDLAQDFDIEVVHGALYVGSRAGAIRNQTHIPDANRRIGELTGVRFGLDYELLLERGSLVLDSQDAARGFGALKLVAGGRDLEVAVALQEAFFLQGSSLSEPATYQVVARRLGLDAGAVTDAFYSSAVRQQVLRGQRWLADLGVSSYPTLLLEQGEGYPVLGSVGDSADALRVRLGQLVG